MSGHGSIHWSELLTPDPDAAKAFFEATAGWSVEAFDMPNGKYWVCMAGGAPVAGIMDVAATGKPDGPAQWMTYIEVDDIDATVGTVAASGGTVAHPPFDVPSVGRIAMIVDPTGAVVGMITPAPREDG